MTDLAKDQNRAHIEKGARFNQMTPCDGSGSASPMPANDLPPGILNPNSMPMTKDAHAGGRHSALQNLGTRPAEKSRAAYAEEIRRRIHGRDTKYR
jgi:hypothetical protein